MRLGDGEGGDPITMNYSSVLAESPQGIFKETELGPLPGNWAVSCIAESCYRPEYGYTASAEQEPVGPRFLRITDIQEQGVNWQTVPYCRCDENTKRKHRLQPGDLLFARIGATTGKSFLVRSCPDAVYASYLIRVRAKGVDPDFLYYFCNSEMYWRQINANKGDKLKGGVSGSVLAQVRHCLPPLPEQRAIAVVLSKIQAAVEVQEKIVAALKELKAATMAKIFREGLRGEPLKQTEIGEIPESWEVKKLQSLCQKTNIVDPTKEPDTSFKYVDVSSVSNEEFRITATTIHTRLTTPSRARKRVLAKDVIIATVRPTLCRIAIVPDSLSGQIVSTAFCVLRGDPAQVLPEYLYYAVLRPEFVSLLEGLQRGASYPAVTDSDVLRQPISVPPIAEQQEICSILMGIDGRMLAMVQKQNALKSLFSSMLHLLMTGRVRVGNLKILRDNAPETSGAKIDKGAEQWSS